MEKPLTSWDRTVYGAITAVFGALLGLGACACLLFTLHGSPPVRWIVLTSATYFFLVGVLRGPDAAFFTGEAIATVGGIALAETGAVPGTSQNSNSRWNSWTSPVLLVAWLTIVGVIAWRA